MFDELRFHLNEVESLLRSNIDRWIATRLGYNADQWTTRLSLILTKLERSFWKLGKHPDELFTNVELPVSSSARVEVRSLLRQLKTLREEAAALRFDSYEAAKIIRASTLSADQLARENPENTPPAPPAISASICRLKASIDANHVWLDDEPFLVHRRSAIYLQAVLENEVDVPRKPISGRAIHERYPDFPPNKVSEYREKLPPRIRELIDTSGNGSCLKPNAYKNPELPDATC